jgi:hypothetical protein
VSAPLQVSCRSHCDLHVAQHVRQNIESVNQTIKGQLDLEQHHGRTPDGVVIRVMQRILALTAAI